MQDNHNQRSNKSSLILLPFKTYVLFAFPLSVVLTQGFRVREDILLIFLGYAISAIALLVGTLILLLAKRTQSGLVTFAFLIAATTITLHLLRHLAQ